MNKISIFAVQGLALAVSLVVGGVVQAADLVKAQSSQLSQNAVSASSTSTAGIIGSGVAAAGIIGSGVNSAGIIGSGVAAAGIIGSGVN
jgi:hypothetical protein